MPHEKDRITSLDRVRSSRSLGQRSGFIASRTVELARKVKGLQLADDLEVVFPDRHLEAAVRGELKKPEGPITQGDLRKLSGLLADSKNIENLSGLEHAVNLTRLDLGKNRISDITPLTSLTNLTKLDLGDNQIIDIAPLASLTQLNWVDLSNNRISNISPLASLIRLRLLFLGLNPLSQESIDVHAPNLSSRRVNVEL